MRVFVSGRLQTRSWEGQDGQSRTVTEIVVEDMIVLTAKSDNLSMGTPVSEDIESPAVKEVASEPVEDITPPPAEEEKPKTTAAKAPTEDVDEDLPF